MEDQHDQNALLKKISKEELKQREEQVQGRMRRKMLALRRLFEGGVERVVIPDGRIENPIKEALNGQGTIIA